MTPLLVALGASVGSVLRFWAAHLLDGERFPTGTLVVNVVGSFLLGALTALALSGYTTALLGVGFCGGLTTYSGFAVGVHRRGWPSGAAYAVVTVALSVAACAGGFALYA